jgi:hypothetical protein
MVEDVELWRSSGQSSKHVLRASSRHGHNAGKNSHQQQYGTAARTEEVRRFQFKFKFRTSDRIVSDRITSSNGPAAFPAAALLGCCVLLGCTASEVQTGSDPSHLTCVLFLFRKVICTQLRLFVANCGTSTRYSVSA